MPDTGTTPTPGDGWTPVPGGGWQRDESHAHASLRIENASLRTRLAEAERWRDQWRTVATETMVEKRALTARAEQAEARVDELERALATLHATTTEGGSF